MCTIMTLETLFREMKGDLNKWKGPYVCELKTMFLRWNSSS